MSESVASSVDGLRAPEDFPTNDQQYITMLQWLKLSLDQPDTLSVHEMSQRLISGVREVVALQPILLKIQ